MPEPQASLKRVDRFAPVSSCVKANGFAKAPAELFLKGGRFRSAREYLVNPYGLVLPSKYDVAQIAEQNVRISRRLAGGVGDQDACPELLVERLEAGRDVHHVTDG